jgi:hypothetical protein
MKKEKIASAVNALLDTCVKKMHTLYTEEEITDFYIHVDASENQLRIVDDNDALLANVSIEAEASDDDDNDNLEAFMPLLRSELQTKLTKLNEAKAFDDVNVFHPFSFVLEEDGLMEDLLIIDDANLIIDNELLKGLEDDLDSFIDKLMKE